MWDSMMSGWRVPMVMAELTLDALFSTSSAAEEDETIAVAGIIK